jgi:ActR/RegA family two-component response regulator
MDSKKNTQAILLVSPDPSQKHSFAVELGKESRLPLVTAPSAEEALAMLREQHIILAVVDDQIGAHSGLDLIRRLIRIDAFMHTAVFTDAGEEEFHQRSEGLGILAKLPLAPGPEDARRLWKMMKQIAGI